MVRVALKYYISTATQRVQEMQNLYVYSTVTCRTYARRRDYSTHFLSVTIGWQPSPVTL